MKKTRPATSKHPTRLQLKKESLQTLTPDNLAGVNGGGWGVTGGGGGTVYACGGS